MSSVLKKKIQTKKARIAVIGLGYVGLPLAVNFAKVGFKVFGLDKDLDRIQRVQNKESYILDVLTSELKEVVIRGHLVALNSFEILKTIDCIIICVPTPLRRKYTPDISYILSAVKTIRQFLKKDTLVILESTTYPGTTRELILPELKKSGLLLDKDFYLAFSPERIDPGNKKYNVTSIPKVVGGLTPQSGQLTKLLYQKVIKTVHLVSNAETAEMAKLLENSFRIINIGWINELAMMCHNLKIDVWEVIEAAKTKPFGFLPFYPGLGVGGHCIPDDPLYLYWKAKQYGFNSKYIKLSTDTNSHMPYYVVGRLRQLIKSQKRKPLSQSRFLIVGVTYKKDVKDLRKSPPLKLIALLMRERAKVEYFDPIIPYLDFEGINLKSIALDKNNLKKYDCVVMATDHSKVNYPWILNHATLIFDIRNIYQDVKNPKVIKL